MVKNIRKVEQDLKVLEQELSTKNPPVFVYMQQASREDLPVLINNLQKLKNLIKLQQKYEFIEWKNALDNGIIQHLKEHKEKVAEDQQMISAYIDHMQHLIKEVENEHQQAIQ